MSSRVSVVETKVALPAVVVACLSVLAGALYALSRAYGFDPTPEQDQAILGVGMAVQYVLYVVIGYLAPHTERPKVEDGGPNPGPDLPAGRKTLRLSPKPSNEEPLASV